MRDLLQTIRAILMWLWPITTWAAGESLGATMGAVTLADWLSLAVLSGVSGLVALLHRVRRSLEAAAAVSAGIAPEVGAAQPIDWRIFGMAHMAGAMFTGAMAFFFMEAGDFNNYIEAAAIALSSFGGARVADLWADRFADRIGGIISNDNGKTS